MKESKTQSQDNQPNGKGKESAEKREGLKKQFSAYDAPTAREFLWVIAVFAFLIAFCWIAYYKLGWFH